VIWLPRSSICSPQISVGLKPAFSTELCRDAMIFCFSASEKSSA